MRGVLALALFCWFVPFSSAAEAQATGCPCGIVSRSISKAHKATQANFRARLADLEHSVVDALKSQTKQLSAGQEKMLAALEALHDAQMETERRLLNENMGRKAVYSRTPTHTGCLAATSGTRLKYHQSVRDDTVVQMNDKIAFWNIGEGRSDQSDGAAAKSIKDHLKKLGEGKSDFGLLLMSGDDLTDEDLENLTLKTQILTNPKPTPLPQLDGSSENAESYLKLQHQAQVRSVVQQYFSERSGRYRKAFEVDSWYEAATGKPSPGKISITRFILSEAERRFTSKEWHGGQQSSGRTMLLNEANKIAAFDLFMRAQEYKQNERLSDMIATLLSMELAK